MLSVMFSGLAFATVELGIFSKKDIDCEPVATSSVTTGSDPVHCQSRSTSRES